jgi:8-oxo-dGTP pyrophosphatase MutT (NUDIX family)
MGTDELLSIFDKDGQPAGLKSRSAVHRDGDWHMLAFVWAARRSPGHKHSFLLQIRGRRDDRFFGHVDAPAGGHVLHNETNVESAIRECEEEIGITLTKEELVYLGRRQVESTPMDCQRTIQHHYLCRRPLALADLRLTEEVTGFLEVDLGRFALLVDGDASPLASSIRTKDQPGVRRAEITSEVLALYSSQVRQTFIMALKACQHVLRTGSPDTRIFL